MIQHNKSACTDENKINLISIYFLKNLICINNTGNLAQELTYNINALSLSQSTSILGFVIMTYIFTELLFCLSIHLSVCLSLCAKPHCLLAAQIIIQLLILSFQFVALLFVSLHPPITHLITGDASQKDLYRPEKQSVTKLCEHFFIIRL